MCCGPGISRGSFAKEYRLPSLVTGTLWRVLWYGIPEAERIRTREAVSSRIVGGMASYSGENPFLAGLIIDLTNQEISICAGTLLNSRKVLTAAQCWFDGYLQGRRITAVLGSLKLFSGGERQNVYSIITHPLFDPYEIVHDLAMLSIPGVTLNEYIKPASLPLSSPERSFVGYTARATGYGILSDRDRVTLAQEQYSVYLSVMSNDRCALYYNQPIDGYVVCTDGVNHWGPCDGDGGAPLVVSQYPGENMLIGVSSFHALAGCQSGYPFGYMRVTAYNSWIQSVLY